MDEQKVTVNVSIGLRPYSFKVQPVNEARVREAARRIEEKVQAYMERYSNREMQDILSIVMLEFMVSHITLEQKEEFKAVKEEIDALDRRLEEYLSGR